MPIDSNLIIAQNPTIMSGGFVIGKRESSAYVNSNNNNINPSIMQEQSGMFVDQLSEIRESQTQYQPSINSPTSQSRRSSRSSVHHYDYDEN